MRFFSRMLRSRRELEDEDARRLLEGVDATPISNVSVRHRSTVAGTVHAVTHPAHGAPPSFAARLDDGTGSIVLVFLGRDRVAGVTPGRRLIAEGMVTENDGSIAIYNPKLELLTGASE